MTAKISSNNLCYATADSQGTSGQCQEDYSDLSRVTKYCEIRQGEISGIKCSICQYLNLFTIFDGIYRRLIKHQNNRERLNARNFKVFLQDSMLLTESYRVSAFRLYAIILVLTTRLYETSK